MMLVWVATTGFAQDLWYDFDGLVSWIPGPRGDGVCKMASYLEADFPIGEGFYVDFFKGRAQPPELGEWGDWWFYVDPGAMRVWYMDGREVPRNPPPGDNSFYLAGVGEVRLTGNSYNVYPTVPESASRVWWDVLVNGGYDIAETDYTNNHEQYYGSCL